MSDMWREDKWFKTVCRSYSNPPIFVDGVQLPGFPSDLIQSNTTGQAGPKTLKEGFVFYEDCIRTFARLGAPLARQHSLLDFGVGWGRIARFFLRELPLDQISGIDVSDEMIA